MPQKLPKLPVMRNKDAPLPIFYVVTPEGHISGIRYERNVSTPILNQEWRRNGQRPVELEAVSVSKRFQQQGYIGLCDLYEMEDRAADFESFLLWVEKANKSQGVTPLPDEYLPDEVLRRRREYREEQTRVDLPPPVRKTKKAAEKATGKAGE